MEKLFLQVLVTAAVSSVLLLVLLFPARRWLEDRYGAQTRYLVWLGLAAVLLLAPLLPRPMAPVQFEVPAYTVPLVRPTQAAENVRPWAAVTAPATAQPVTPPVTQVGTPQITVPITAGPAVPQITARSVAWTELLAWAWLAVAVLLLAVQTARCLWARRRLMKASTPLDGKGKVQLRTLSGLDTPMTLGLLHPVVFLPEGEVSPLAVEHELTHVRRGDLWGKAFLFLACTFYWFDPLVWQMARVAGRDMEAACDAQVVSGFSSEEKRRYGELLLNAASGCKAVPLTTRFGGSKEQMKTRLAQLFRSGKRSRALVAVLVIAALALTSLVACQSGEETDPTATPAPAATPDPAAYEAYAKVLRDFLSEGILPDGTQLSPEEREYLENNPFAMADKDGDITEKQTLPIGINTFAVADVDGDGREELIFCYETTYVASMRAFVLDHSDGAMKLQLTAFPALIFYSNGMVKELDSNNQSGAELWPYSLYSYDAEADRCQWACSVFTNEAIPEEAGQGDQYPADADKSGTATVYHVTEDDRNWESMDEAGYQAWLDKWLGGATEVEVTWKHITPANIAALLGEERSEALVPLAELEEKYAISGYYPGFTFDTVNLDGRDWYRLTQNDGFYTLYVDPTETCLRAEFEDVTDGYDTTRVVRLYDLPRFLPTGQSGEKTELRGLDITGDGVDDLVVRISDGKTEYCRVMDARYGKVYKLSDLSPAMLSRLNGETVSVPAGTVDTLADRLLTVPEALRADVYAVPGNGSPGIVAYWLDRPWTNKNGTGIGCLFSVWQMSRAEYKEAVKGAPSGFECLARRGDTYYGISYATEGIRYHGVEDAEPYNIAFHSMREYALQVLLATEGMEPLRDLTGELEAAVMDWFSWKRDAVNGVALPPEVADSPLGREVTARAQVMRANYAAQGTYIVSIETEYRDFAVRWVEGDAVMVSLYEWTWVNYNRTGEAQPATDRMGWGFPHDVTLTLGDSGYTVTRDLSAEFEETDYQSELCQVSDNYDWLGQGYGYTSETLGVRVEFPPEWKKYFTFEERVIVDGFLQSGQACPVLELASAFVLNDDPTYDTTFARIFWIPRGDAVAGGDGKTLVTLLITDEGAYVCEVNVIHQLNFDPNTGVGAPHPEYKEIRAIYETVQNGILDGRWWFETLSPL